MPPATSTRRSSRSKGGGEAAKANVAPPSSSDPGALESTWEVPEPMQEVGQSQPIALRLDNTTSVALTASVKLEIIGLGVRRFVTLADQIVPAAASTRILWSPHESPVRPVGTSARVVAQITFTQDKQSATLLSSSLRVAYSADLAMAYASLHDDAAVRLASLGVVSAAATSARAEVAAQRQILVSQLGSGRGLLDGRALATSRAQQESGLASSLMSDVDVVAERAVLGDSVGFDEPLATQAAAPAASELDGTLANPTPMAISTCLAANTITNKICAKWASPFRDESSSVANGANVVAPDYRMSNTLAAYANARILDEGSTLWSGRLGSDGCTPAVTFCRGRSNIEVSTSSFQVPDQLDFGLGALIYGTREVRITPARVFVSPIDVFTIAGRGTFAVAGVTADEPAVRVAAVVGRMLSMSDSGVLRRSQIVPTPPILVVDVGNGCSTFPDFYYGDGPSGRLYGEACAGANSASFGPSLGVVNGVPGRPTGRHTTEYAYVVGHELGHTVQISNGARPEGPDYGAPGDSGYSVTGTGDCSCAHVAEGNRYHCLTSRHAQSNANTEGFAHFFAARLMNNQEGNARFTYYKTHRSIVWTVGVLFDYTRATYPIAPPYALNAAQPYSTPVYSGTGWTRTYCPATNGSSEYDWLTFLWAVNGNAVGAERVSMSQLLTILKHPSVVTDFRWPNVLARSRATLVMGSPSAARFEAEAHRSAVDY